MAVEGYQPDFDIDYRRGKVGENLVDTFLAELEGSTIEVKTDYRAFETGNLYIEVQQQLPDGQWVYSGLAISKAKFYCFAGPTGVGFVTIGKNELVSVVKALGRPVTLNRSGPKTRATKGFLIKVTDVTDRVFQKGNREYY